MIDRTIGYEEIKKNGDKVKRKTIACYRDIYFSSE